MATGCVPDIESDKKSPRKWEFSKQYTPLNDFEVVTIVTFKAAFEISVQQTLANCDLGAPMVTTLN